MATSSCRPSVHMSVTRPATISSLPSWISRLIRPATSGAMRWRWTSHQGRAWRRKRRCSDLVEALPHGLAVRPQTIDRRPPADRRAAIEQPAPQPLQAIPSALPPASPAPRHARRGRAASARAATAPSIRPRSRASSRLSTTSTMVRPVPMSSTSPPLAAALAIAAPALFAPRIVDEQLGRQATRQRRQRRRLVALRQRPAPGHGSAIRRPATQSSPRRSFRPCGLRPAPHSPARVARASFRISR